MYRYFVAFDHIRRTLGPNDALCCVFHRRLIAEVFGEPVVARAHASLWSVFDPDDDGPKVMDPWGPVTAVVRVGIGTAMGTPVAGAMHTVQGWHKDGWGHTFLWLATSSTMGIRIDSAAPSGKRSSPGPEIVEMAWADVVAKYVVDPKRTTATGVRLAAHRLP